LISGESGGLDAVLWLVRHGQTDWNLEGRYMGQTDLPLNQNGITQAYQIAPFFDGRPIAAIYSSDMLRALQTASILSEHIGIPIQRDKRLREINQGELEGQPFPVIRIKYPEFLQARERTPLSARPPGGETIWEVARRVYQAADEITSRHPGKEIIVISHGLSLATLLVHANGESLAVAFNRIPENAQPIRVVWKVSPDGNLNG